MLMVALEVCISGTAFAIQSYHDIDDTHGCSEMQEFLQSSWIWDCVSRHTCFDARELAPFSSFWERLDFAASSQSKFVVRQCLRATANG